MVVFLADSLMKYYILLYLLNIWQDVNATAVIIFNKIINLYHFEKTNLEVDIPEGRFLLLGPTLCCTLPSDVARTSSFGLNMHVYTCTITHTKRLWLELDELYLYKYAAIVPFLVLMSTC